MTALLLFGAETVFPLPERKRPYELGSAARRDISIESPFVSKLHCRLRRKGAKLHVIDVNSTNGTYFRGERDSDFVVKPGDVFMVGSSKHRLLALNDEMRAHHDELLRILGWPEEHKLPSETPPAAEMMLAAQGDAPLLIKSEYGCDQDRLARIIHEISPFRDARIVELARSTIDDANVAMLKRQARSSTLVIDLEDQRAPVAPEIVSMLSQSRHEMRVIVLARSAEVAAAALGKEYVYQLTQYALRPVVDRRQVAERLLDRMFSECKSPLRVRSLTAHNQAALRSYAWSNFVELRMVTELLTAIAWSGSINQTAQDLGMVRSSVHDLFTRQLKLRHPLVAARIDT